MRVLSSGFARFRFSRASFCGYKQIPDRHINVVCINLRPFIVTRMTNIFKSII
jgi:hypothetical protein